MALLEVVHPKLSLRRCKRARPPHIPVARATHAPALAFLANPPPPLLHVCDEIDLPEGGLPRRLNHIARSIKTTYVLSSNFFLQEKA